MAGSGRGDARAAATADLIGGCPTGQSRNQETRSKALLVVVVVVVVVFVVVRNPITTTTTKKSVTICSGLAA
jgi:hypothetical protein